MTLRSAWSAAAWYLVATVVLTWPTTAGLTRDIPWDLGDSLLNAWILGWNADHLLRFLSGQWGALDGFWTANIFGHEPLTLAYSEHLLALTLPILPVYALTGNLILCYNLLFLSTFFLSAVGTYLLVRDLSDSPRAAFAAGLFYAFSLYRIGQFSHLQVLSSQWMPFVLFGMRRYFEHRRPRALVGASAALVAQNLSCGYFLFFFSPFVLAYALFELGSRGLWRDRAVWTSLSLAAVGVSVATVPFLLPYLELRMLGQPGRTLQEVTTFSADVYSYLSAHWFHPLYGGWLRVWNKPEGELFPGALPLLLAVVGVGAHLGTLWRDTRRVPDRRPRWEVWTTGTVLVLAATVLAFIVFTGGGGVSVGPVTLSLRQAFRPLVVGLVAAGVLVWRSARARAFLRGSPGSVVAFFAVALAASFVLSLGPMPQIMGRRLADTGPYFWLYEYVPGFDGLRVPARFAMPFMLFLAVLAGFGVRALERTRRGPWLALVFAALFLVEANTAPINMNQTTGLRGLAAVPDRVLPGPDTLPIYREVRALPDDVLVAELPFGEWQYELRYVYYSTTHWRRLLNGFSGYFPSSYVLASTVLRDLPARQNEAWDTLLRANVTHVVVHEGAYLGDEGARVTAWLRARGAREVATAGQDRMFELRP